MKKSSNQPLVSCLMPVYNAEKTLRRAMDSIIGQTYKNIEFIIIDGYSTDDTLSMLNEYARKDKRIKIYRDECNIGVAKSLNRGLALCSGKYIARMDSDDYSYPNRIEKQVEYMEKHDEIGILGCNVRRIIENKNLRMVLDCPTDKEEIRCWLLFNIHAVHPTVMFRTATVRDLNIEYPDLQAEDYDLFASLINKVPMANLPEVLLDYYVGSDTQLTTVCRRGVRERNAAISRRTIEECFGIDTSEYPDSLFGARGMDLIPYDICDYLKRGKKLLVGMLEANKVRKLFVQSILKYQLGKEWDSIKGMVHMNEPSDVLLESAMNEIEKDVDVVDLGRDFFPSGKVIVYGTGSYANENVPLIIDEPTIDLIAFCDSNPDKRGKKYFGRSIIAPEDIADMEYDFIYVAAPVYYLEILDTLMGKCNVPECRIIDFRRIHDMNFIKQRQIWCKEYETDKKIEKAYMFCAPDYANIGDHAIAYAEQKFFERNFKIEIAEIPTRRYREAADIARHYIRDDDLILITGGGFLGSLWMNTEDITRRVVEMYPNNKILIMPQTVYWEENAVFNRERELTRNIYAKHRDLTLCARDRISFKLMKEIYPETKVIMAPDMVLSMDWRDLYNEKQIREGGLLCLKNDKESILDDLQKKKLFCICEELVEKIDQTSNLYGISYLPKEKREEVLISQLNRFRASSICITDRLHGMLFSAITETPCVVLNSCNHKLKTGYEWLHKLPYIEFAENIDEVKEKVAKVISVKNPKFEVAAYEDSYVDLMKVIKNRNVKE